MHIQVRQLGLPFGTVFSTAVEFPTVLTSVPDFFRYQVRLDMYLYVLLVLILQMYCENAYF